MDSFKKRKICKFSVERILFEIFNILFQDNVEEKEGDKILLRRERNRVAATKCRNKKKVKLNIIIGKAEAIENSNNSVMQDISEWRQRRDIYILSCQNSEYPLYPQYTAMLVSGLVQIRRKSTQPPLRSACVKIQNTLKI